MPSVRQLDPSVGAFFFGLCLLPCALLVGRMRGQINPLGLLVFLAVGVTATCFVAAAWEQRTFLGARTRLGRAGTVLTVFGWIFGMLLMYPWPSDDGHAIIRQQTTCASNLRQIGQAMLLYANDHGGRYPDRLEELLFSVAIESSCFVCPGSDDAPATGPTTRAISDAIANGGRVSYIYLGKDHNANTVTVNMVMAYEGRGNHTSRIAGINVLFGDGHVEFVNEVQASRLIAKLRGGENPPMNWR